MALFGHFFSTAQRCAHDDPMLSAGSDVLDSNRASNVSHSTPALRPQMPRPKAHRAPARHVRQNPANHSLRTRFLTRPALRDHIPLTEWEGRMGQLNAQLD